MARCKLTPQEFIQSTFSPMVAVLTSSAVENICKKNNLSFIQMLRPFCKLSTEGHLKDPSGGIVTIKNLRLSLCDVNWRPPEPPLARTYFNECVSSYDSERTTSIAIGSTKLDIPVSVPWYEAWRHTFFQVQFPSDHEFTKHYVGCILVVSTSDSSPLETLAELVDKLQSLMSEAPAKLPKWFGPSPMVFVSYLLLHDNTTGESIKGESVFEAMKTTYGIGRCFYLSINSQTTGTINNSSAQSPDPWAQFITSYHRFHEKTKDDVNQGIETAQEAAEKSNVPKTPGLIHPLSPLTEEVCVNTPNGHVLADEHDKAITQHGQYLTAEDINKIRSFINDLCTKALIPHFEQQIHVLSEQVSNKKGVSRSLFSATKRWFAPSKPGSQGNNIPPTAIAYQSDSHELQLRRLGDLCFMVGHYSLAFTAYHSAKRDFFADGAWLHYAGALEMAALSAFMSNSDNFSKKCIDYAEESIMMYLNSCRMPQFATRATILSVECLKGKGLFGEAANQLIRMTSEDSDLRSAVLLEQAAYCFLHSKRPIMHRKYAFHMVMAGHRYSKAGHKLHSIRCYRQAYQVYEGKCWSVAEDHINFTVGKQSIQLKQYSNAVDAFSKLVTRSSRQSNLQQQVFIKEYIAAVQQLKIDGLETLSIPVIKYNNIQVLLGHPLTREHITDFIPASGITFENTHYQNKEKDDMRWLKMEERLVSASLGMTPMVLKPTIELSTNKTDNSSSPVIVVGEVVSLCIDLENPLHVLLKLCNICLVWNMETGDGKQFNSDTLPNECALTESIEEIIIPPNSTKHVVLTITATLVGKLNITGLTYTLIDSSNNINVRGKQSFFITPFRDDQKEDKRLQLLVIKEAPYMHVNFKGLKDNFVCSEIVPVELRFKNSGLTPISRILFTSSKNFVFCLKDYVDANNEVDGHSVIEFPLNKPIETESTGTYTIYFRAPLEKCEVSLDLLFYYEGIDTVKTRNRYRLVRHTWPAIVHKYVSVSAKASISNSSIMCKDGMNIKIELSNHNKTDDPHNIKLFLHTVSLFSLKWSLVNKIFSPCDVEIKCQESLLFMVQALRKDLPQEGPPTTITFKENSSDLPLQYFTPSSKESNGNSDLQAVCVVSWMGDMIFQDGISEQIFGQEYLILNSFDEKVTTFLPSVIPMKVFGEPQSDITDLKKRLISFQICHPSKVSVNNKKICIIPVKVVLHNYSDVPVNAHVEAVSVPVNSSESSLIALRFLWIGQTLFFQEINALSSASVFLNAAITAPGAYNLSARLNVLVRTQEETVVQTCKPEAVVMVL